MTDWVEITRRNARSVQTTIGWIFWDPGAVERYGRLGLPGPLGYIAARAAPLAPAGADAVDRRVRFDQPGGDPARLRPRRATHDLRRGVGRARRGRARRAARVRARDRRSARALAPGALAGRRAAPHRRPGPVRRAPADAAPRRSVALRLARGELSARVAGRHALGARRGVGSRRRRGLDPPQRVARLRARLAAPVARLRSRDARTGVGVAARTWARRTAAK